MFVKQCCRKALETMIVSNVFGAELPAVVNKQRNFADVTERTIFSFQRSKVDYELRRCYSQR